MNNSLNLIWSDSLEELIVRRFKNGKHIYTWNDKDCVYYRDDTDEICRTSIPDTATILKAF